MSQQQKLEKVLDLLLSEDSDQAAELLHQIIVEKARTIYESIVDEEEVVDVDAEETVTEAESDEVGGEPNTDFTDEISSDEDEISSDEENDGEADADADDLDSEGSEGTTEERVEDLESQLAELRAEFDALMGEEMQEPFHDGNPADGEVDAEMDGMGGMDDGSGMPDFAGSGEEKVVGEVVATMFEKNAAAKLPVAPQAKKQGNKVAEETKFLNKTPDTGQRGTAKLVGTGKNTPLGAEQTKSPYTNIPPRKDYGGKPTPIGGDGGTGGEYGKWNGDSAKDDTPTDNVNIQGKKSGIKADTTPKYTGGKPAGPGFTKSPLTNKPK